MNQTRLFFISFAFLGYGAHAAQAPRADPVTAKRSQTTAKVQTRLAPFTYRHVLTESWESKLPVQRTLPICRDFLAYLNHPRSNEIFRNDGSLVREGEKIKSVNWETIEKDTYRAGFMTAVDLKVHPNIRKDLLERYAKPEYVLQRTRARPYESWPLGYFSGHSAYRLVSLDQMMSNPDDQASQIPPTWFPQFSEEWLGDARGRLNPDVIRTLSGGRRQWIVHGDVMYAVENNTPSDRVIERPAYLQLDVDQLEVSGKHAVLFPTCSFRARK